MADVHLKHIDYAHIKIEADPHIIMELSTKLTFFAPNYKWHPKVKARVWDGKISMVNRLSGICLAGLAQRIKKFCDQEGYSITFDDELYYDNISEKELQDHIDSLNIPKQFSQRDYQFKSALKCIRSKRRLLISATSSGKSFMIYIIGQWFKEKTMIIVPTTGLVTQFENDLREYGFKGKISTSIGGLDKSLNIDCDYLITTWQAIDNGKGNKIDPEWFDQFGCVFGDEAHTMKAVIVKGILSKMTECKYRFGTTGTLGDEPLDRATIEGLFGPVYKAISAKEMIDGGYASKLTVKCIVLKYEPEFRKELLAEFKKLDKNNQGNISGAAKYNAEVEYLNSLPERNEFIKNLILSLEGNKLLFFQRKIHGKLFKELLGEATNIYHIDGNVTPTKREEIRRKMEQEDNTTLIASSKTTSTGVSIKNLKHMIAAASSKAKIGLLQSIGRMLRQHATKEETGAVMYDIVDDLSVKSSQNYTLQHFLDRCKIYDSEKFDYKIYNVKIKKSK